MAPRLDRFEARICPDHGAIDAQIWQEAEGGAGPPLEWALCPEGEHCNEQLHRRWLVAAGRNRKFVWVGPEDEGLALNELRRIAATEGDEPRDENGVVILLDPAEIEGLTPADSANAIVVVSKVTTGTESEHLLGEAARYGDTVGSVERRDGTLTISFRDSDTAAARRMVEDVLTIANPSWSIHVRLMQ